MPEFSLSLSAVIFDCDGVLVDTEPLHYRAFQEVLSPMGLGFGYEHYLKAYIGFDDRDAFLEAFREAGRSVEPDELEQIIKGKSLALQRITSNGISSFPGVVTLVRELIANKVPLAVASGSLHSEVEAFTTALGLRDAFRVIVAADDVTRSKPDPETYSKVLEKFRECQALKNLEPFSCVAIEDTPAGIESAKSAGLYVIGVANSYPIGRLRGLADHIVESLTELDYSHMVQLMKRSERT
ncbi:MAG: HAD family hydrolase [Syntrophobacteraceae bacterium]